MNKEQLTEALETWETPVHFMDRAAAAPVIVAAAREHLACNTVTDQMVERAAKAMHESAAPEFDVEEIPWQECHELYQMDRRLAARAALEAALRVEETWATP